MPVMMRCAASSAWSSPAFSNRSIDCARRALSVTPTPVRELRTMLVATPPGCTTDSLTGLFAICKLMPQALGKAAHREFRRA